MTQNQLTDWRGLLEDLVEEMNALSAHLEGTTPLETVLSGLRAWNRARAALAQPEPEGRPAPAPAGEVADEARYLVKELRDQADDLSPSLELFGLIHRAADLLECQATACAICERERLHQSTRAADLEVERQAAPVPVAVSTEEEDAK